MAVSNLTNLAPPTWCDPSEEAPPLPLLVTGVSGVAGYNAWRSLRAKFGEQVWGLRQASNWRLDTRGVLACDVEDLVGLRRLFAEHRFAAVLDCGGNCALRSCELDPGMAWRINYESVVNLVTVLREFPARLVRLSIDLVFAGRCDGNYRENDETDPVTIYGKSMAAAEQWLLQSAPETCIARISLPMGPSPNHHAGAIDWIQSRFRQNKAATLYFDEVRTPTYTDCLTHVSCVLLRSSLGGISSNERGPLVRNLIGGLPFTLTTEKSRPLSVASFSETRRPSRMACASALFMVLFSSWPIR